MESPIKSVYGSLGQVMSMAGSMWYGLSAMEVQEATKKDKESLIKEDSEKAST